MLRLDGYVRVSRVGGREGEGYISPAVQRSAIESYARELGGEIVAWQQDEDFSGGSVERPAFQSSLARLEGGQTDGLVVMAIDRFARSTADGAAIVRQIVDRGQVFASCHERIDPRTPEGGYMLRSFLNNAELFLDRIKAGWWTSKRRAIARGAHIGPTPIGYLKVDPLPSKPTHISPVDSAALGGPTAPGLLVPSPDLGPAISELFGRAAMREHGDSSLARWFTERAPHPSGRTWQPSEIRRWLGSRIYLGEVRYGELVNGAAHEPLTDPDTWKRSQREPGRRRGPQSSFLLSGLVRCAYCRYSMGGQTYGGAKGDTPVYRCAGRAGCAEPSVIVASRLDEFVLGEIRKRLRKLRIRGTRGADLDRLDREARLADDELQAFAADLEARRLLGEAGWQKGLRVRAADRDAKVARRDKALSESEAVAIARKGTDLSVHELGDLLAMVRHVFVRRQRGAPASERALIVWSDDPTVIDVPGPHRSGPFEPIGW